jgi:predicted DNA-binding transcriptional regulator AlpA
MKQKDHRTNRTSALTSLPETGLLRIWDVLQFIRVSKTTWWNGVKSGRFPASVKDGGITAWRAEDIRAYIDRHQPQTS